MILCPSCTSTAVVPEYRFRCGVQTETRSCLDCGHTWPAVSQYPPATEEPEDEAPALDAALVAPAGLHVISPEQAGEMVPQRVRCLGQCPSAPVFLPEACHVRLMAEALVRIREVTALPDCPLSELPDLIENLLSELADRQIRADIEPSA